MRYCPHLFVMQQQMKMQQQMMRQRQMQEQQGGSGHDHQMHGHAPGMTGDPVMMGAVAEMMKDGKIRDRVEALSVRMSKIQVKVNPKISSWTQVEKKSFIDEFSHDPLLESLNQCGK